MLSPMPTDVPSEVLSSWSALAGRPARRFGTGLINETFLVEGADGRVVLQRLHPVFAGEVNEDIDAVTRHLAAKGLDTPRLVPTDSGALWATGRDGRPWRAQTFVEGTSVDRIESPSLAREAAAFVGRWHAAVADLAWDYRHVRANVHDTPRHLATLVRALERGGGHRLFAEVEPLAQEILSAGARLPDFAALPTRHAHGDLKISNLLFGPDGRARCLVDLDTVGRMPWPFELGDALRSWCNPAGEDVASASVDPAIFAAAVEGYASTARALVTAAERDLLVDGLATICLELAARFLADALEESYFGWDPTRFPGRGEHNLLRARGQWSLHGSVLARRRELEAVVARAFGG